jgi:hypothetical protein
MSVSLPNNGMSHEKVENVSKLTVIRKGKAVPLQAWSGPEDSRNLRFPDFMTMAQDGGNVVSPKRRPHLPPGISLGTHLR